MLRALALGLTLIALPVAAVAQAAPPAPAAPAAQPARPAPQANAGGQRPIPPGNRQPVPPNARPSHPPHARPSYPPGYRPGYNNNYYPYVVIDGNQYLATPQPHPTATPKKAAPKTNVQQQDQFGTLSTANH
jgi:hypothetical protein